MKTLFTALMVVAFSASAYAAKTELVECKIGAQTKQLPYSVCIQEGVNRKR
ncbi:hypothetical protein [Vibrio sp. WXL103]|uniref:hypothetical protein n=1 Tax=Vibrio sp. WXL103 TaxID=3450710 RepID=UPI003EC917F4